MDGNRPRPGMAMLIYLLPALMDLALALVLFAATVRVARLGGTATRVASVLAVWSLVYVVACPMVGRMVTPRNAHRLVLSGCILFTLACALLAAAATYLPMIVLVGITGMAAALIFVSFQIFMKQVDAASGRPLSYSVGLYTFAWSAGYACGPLVAGYLMQLGAPAVGGEGPGWRYAFLSGAGLSLALSVVLAILFRGRSRKPTAPEAAAPAPTPCGDATLPDLAWLGWIGGGAGFAALAINRTVFASRAVTELHLTDGTIGAIFFILCLVQAFTGLALSRSRTWMYRPRPVAAFAVPGIIGLLCFGFGRHPAVFLAGAALFGIYSGAFCFYLVFHALIHPERSGRYIGINETVVGLTGFAAPLLGGGMADAWGIRYPFAAAAGLTAVVTAFQFYVHFRHRRCRVTPRELSNWK